MLAGVCPAPSNEAGSLLCERIGVWDAKCKMQETRQCEFQRMVQGGLYHNSKVSGMLSSSSAEIELRLAYCMFEM